MNSVTNIQFNTLIRKGLATVSLAFIFVITLFLGLQLGIQDVQAATSDIFTPKCTPEGCPFTFLAPIGFGGFGSGGVLDVAKDGATTYLKGLYTFGIAIAAALAVLMITLGGVQYSTTDAIGGKSEGKEKIKSALIGLLLALLSYTILNTINPYLVVMPENIKEDGLVPVISTDSGIGNVAPEGNPAVVPVAGSDGSSTPIDPALVGVVKPEGYLVMPPGAGSHLVGSGNVSIDFDGSPGAYRVEEDPNGPFLINGKRYKSTGYENLLNAKSGADINGAWVGVKTENGQPIIDSNGYLTGVLSYGNGSINGNKTPFVALSTEQLNAARSKNPNFKLGDKVYVTSGNQTITAIYADNAGSRGSSHCELSPAAATALGITYTRNSASGNCTIKLP